MAPLATQATLNPNPAMQPQLRTPRLVLRPFDPDDADDVQRIAGDVRVAEPTAHVPHPYPDGVASEWIASHAPAFRAGTDVIYAVTSADTGELLGAVQLAHMSTLHRRAELGYWVAFAHWSSGICSEAVGAVIRYAHSELGISRIVCSCLPRNIGSERVMQKAGFLPEGRLVKHVNHRGVFEDMLIYGLNLPGR